MDISLRWINKYLSPAGLSADEADQLLTQAGFPIEGITQRPDGDVVLDVEVTSNRGDCLSHIGCAREVAAMRAAGPRRELTMPTVREPTTAGKTRDALRLENHDHRACPLFTAHVVKGCAVGPSPAWLVEALESVGQRSINNVVDVTNFITLEFGNPCHVFDLDKLADNALIIRYANEGETLTTLDGKPRTLKATDLVVADAERATSLAGVIGGQDSEVDASTTDVVFEMATWDPVTIRTAARRLGIRTDAGYRFERGVHPASIKLAARRAVALLCELTGGVCQGEPLSTGDPIPDLLTVNMRPSRAAALLGKSIPVSDLIALLRDLEIQTEQISEDELQCVIPPHRLDLTREIDLIEEIARGLGLDAVRSSDTLAIRPRPLQASERAMREVARVLTGFGFYETVTFSFVSPAEAAVFLPCGKSTVEVDDDRRKAEPTLRPSVIPGLLGCRRSNRDAGNKQPGGMRLFEVAQKFMQTSDHQSIEERSLALVLDVPIAGKKAKDTDLQTGIRQMRGVLDALVRSMFGPAVTIRIVPAEPDSKAWHPRAFARLEAAIGTHPAVTIACFGLLSEDALRAFDLDAPVAAAEIALDALIAPFPPLAVAERLPSYPSIERDLSLVVAESVSWAQIESMVDDLNIDRMAGCSFVGTFRDPKIGSGAKSVTIRLAFRDADRTLRHEEVDPQIERVTAAAQEQLGATIRV